MKTLLPSLFGLIFGQCDPGYKFSRGECVDIDECEGMVHFSHRFETFLEKFRGQK